MASDDGIELDGEVVEVLGGTRFRVRVTVENEDFLVLTTLSGKMRKNKIRVVLGDLVKISVSPYDQTRGRIVFRKR